MKLKADNPNLLAMRSIHPKRVLPPVIGKLFKPATANSKLGGKGKSNVIRKGKWTGMPMFSLTLQERATCPQSCHHLDDCFGNNMGFAHRFQHGEELEQAIRAEIGFLARMYPQGFVVRLHILGDFYSAQYVQVWHDLMAQYSNLRVFGYSARYDGDDITEALIRIRYDYSDRWWVRFSTNIAYDDDGMIFAAREDFQGESVTCPEQTGKADDCLSCGYCWAGTKTVKFLSH